MELLSKKIIENKIYELGNQKSDMKTAYLIRMLKDEYEILDKFDKECIQPVNTYEDLLKRIEGKHIYFFSDEQIRYFNDAVRLCEEIKAICER